MNARESDPMHDDIITQEEFEQAATMNFPTITIPTPIAVAAWIDQQVPGLHPSRVSYSASGYHATHWHEVSNCLAFFGATPEELLANLRARLAEHDPLAKLRKEWEAMGKPDLNARDLAPPP